MAFIGRQPTPAPLTSSDITDGIVSKAKIANDAIDNTKLDLTDDYAFTGTITGAGQSLRPNSKPIIINGDMAVSQRTTSTTIANDGLVTDRFKHQISHDGATTVTQESLSSGNAYTNGFANALKIDVTTADSSLSASQRYFINYAIEGTDIQNIKKGTSSAEKLTLAFWVKATKTGTNVVRCYTADSDRSCSQSYTISSSNTWEHKVLNFPADTTGTVIADDNTSGMIFTWGVAVGSTYSSGTLQTTWGANTSANDYVGQVNNLDNTSNNFHLTGVQLEVGEFSSTTIPSFQFETFEENLSRCRRYYQTYENQRFLTTFNDGNTSDRLGVNFTFNTEMRNAPSISKNLNSQNVINESTTIYGYSLGCDKSGRGSMTSIDTMRFDAEL
tara:strand:- start:284 stop:1444 length:1161 start_codon:yes stop_codon:yes gene_type:complete